MPIAAAQSQESELRGTIRAQNTRGNSNSDYGWSSKDRLRVERSSGVETRIGFGSGGNEKTCSS